MAGAKNNPTVSVVIPTYNRAHLIGRVIQSVLNQTYQDFEIIVIDDGSSDDTEEVVKNFNDERIRYTRHEKNKGAPTARNSGIKNAKGEYIAFLDDDDEWLPEKLGKQINKFQTLSNDIGLVYSGFYYVSDISGRIISEVIPTLRGNVYVNLLQGCILGSPTPLIRKNCFQKAGFFDETLPSCQDWDMWIRLSKYYEFDFVPDILAKHHVHGSQISVDLNAKIQAREKLLRKYQSDLSKHPSILSRHLTRLGALYCVSENLSIGRKYFLASIKHRPLQRYSYIHFLLSVFAPGIQKNILKKQGVLYIDEVAFYY